MRMAYTGDGSIHSSQPGYYDSAPDVRGRSPGPRPGLACPKPLRPRAFWDVSRLYRSAVDDSYDGSRDTTSKDHGLSDSPVNTAKHELHTLAQDPALCCDSDASLSLLPMDAVDNIFHLFRPASSSRSLVSRNSPVQSPPLRYHARSPVSSRKPRRPTFSPRRRVAVHPEASEGEYESSLLLLSINELTRMLETELLRDHPRFHSYFRAVQGELREGPYREFLVAVLHWWKGRLHTSRLLDQFRLQTIHLVRKASKAFASTASLLEALTPLLHLRGPSKLYLCFSETKELMFVILEVINDSQVFPVSSEAIAAACDISNTEGLRTVLASSHALHKLLEVDPIWAPCIMQLLQLELDNATPDEYRKKCLKYLRQLAKTFHVLPPSLSVSDIERTSSHAVRGGGFADIWKGQCGGQTVCLKVLRMFTESDERIRKKLRLDFCHEALIWKQLRHPNVLPFLGVNTDAFAPGFCLVSPWMSNGDIMSYLKNHPGHDKRVAITEIANGMDYLHSLHPPIIHGDIRGANILINNEGRCCLADFGLALVAESQVLASTNGGLRGSVRWLAPELIHPSDDLQTSGIDMRPRDVYAFACTSLEIISGQIPFANRTMEAQVILDVMNGIRPPRPQGVWCPDDIWKLIDMCWSQDSTHRPSSKRICLILDHQASGSEKGQIITSFSPLHSPAPSSQSFHNPIPPCPSDSTQNVMWVENIPSDTRLGELQAFFNKCVPELRPLSISAMLNRGCALVKYNTEVKLVKAISTFNGQALRPSVPSGPLLKCHALVKDDARRYFPADGRPGMKAFKRVKRDIHLYSRDGYSSSPILSLPPCGFV